MQKTEHSHIKTINEYTDVKVFLDAVDYTSDKRLHTLYDIAIVFTDDLPKYMKRDKVKSFGDTKILLDNLISAFIVSVILVMAKAQMGYRLPVFQRFSSFDRNVKFSFYEFEWLLKFERYCESPTLKNELALITTKYKMTPFQRKCQHLVQTCITRSAIKCINPSQVYTLNAKPVTHPIFLKTEVNNMLDEVIATTFFSE